jgi:urate oxidase
MGIRLGTNHYGKAETRVFRIVRDTDRHVVRDLNVSTSLWGDFADAHVSGDQAHVLPTDTQKNTVFAYASDPGIGTPEEFGLLLARHFVDDVAPVTRAEVRIEEYPWERVADHDHGFRRTGPEVRTATVTVGDGAERVASGVRDLVVLKSTGSEFAGFLVDGYTTLAPTHDRVLATSLTATWTHTTAGRTDWDASYAGARHALLDRFTAVHSLALQQSLWEMGRAVLAGDDRLDAVDLVAPNIHHIGVDLAPFGLENRGEVFHVTDRPYGLIEVTVERDGDGEGA